MKLSVPNWVNTAVKRAIVHDDPSSTAFSKVMADLAEGEVDRETGIERAISIGRVKEVWQAGNIQEIVEKAELSSEKEELQKLDLSWFANFHDAAKNVSDEQIQDLWARILKGEIEKPCSFSLRTIQIVGMLDQQVAELFQKVCDTVWHFGPEGHYFYPVMDYRIHWDKTGLMLSNLEPLSELGLVHIHSEVVALEVEGEIAIASFGEYKCELKPHQNVTYNLPVGSVSLTKAGKELYALCDPVRTDELQEIALDYWRSEKINIKPL